MGAEYDQRDARGFINLIGLPIQVRAVCENRPQEASRTKSQPMKLWGGSFEKARRKYSNAFPAP